MTTTRKDEIFDGPLLLAAGGHPLHAPAQEPHVNLAEVVLRELARHSLEAHEQPHWAAAGRRQSAVVRQCATAGSKATDHGEVSP